MDRLFNVRETAEKLGVTTQAINKWIKQGKLKRMPMSGVRSVRISEEEINRFINNDTTILNQ
jgi:excisionase family DNA binding protein